MNSYDLAIQQWEDDGGAPGPSEDVIRNNSGVHTAVPDTESDIAEVSRRIVDLDNVPVEGVLTTWAAFNSACPSRQEDDHRAS